MASVNTISSKEYQNGVKIVSVSMVCASGSAAFTEVLLEERGKRLHSIDIVPDLVTGPTDDSDLLLTDNISGVNLIATNGVDAVDNATTNNILPDTVANIIKGSLTLAISNNAVVTAAVTIYLTFEHDF